MENSTLESLLSNDNSVRSTAELFIEQQRTSDPTNLFQTFITGMKNDNLDISSIACVLFKKYFLDDRRSEGVTIDELEQMKTTVMATLDFSQPMKLLKRKGDIISKIYSKQDKNEDLLKMMVEWAQSDNNVGRQFSMYIFEVISDCHLTAEQIATHKDSFMKIFAQTLTDRDIQVKVASLKATTAFLTSVDDSETALAYMEIIPHLLNTVVEALQTNEESGKVALESMVELTNTHPEIFKKMTGQLINVIAQVMTQKNFEEGTRSVATEVILALSSQMPASLRKADETKTMLIPALVSMLTEVDEDMEAWAATVDAKDSGSVDPFNTAINAFNRLSVDLGEKTILTACTPIIKSCIQSQDWKQRQAGYMIFGLIAESCKESLAKNMDEAMKMACSGLVDSHPRVRFAGLSCTALLLTEISPKAQYKFHAELMPMFISMMTKETMIKIQTHAVSTTINFARGLINEEEGEKEETNKNTKIMMTYAQSLFTTLANLLKKAMQDNYEPLQEEVLALLSISASIMEKDFTSYYSVFMPMMLEILNNVGMTTMQQKSLRSKTIETMGFMIEAISEEKTTFFSDVLTITTNLVTLMNSGLSNDDPQMLSIKETLTKIAYFLKEDFNQFMPIMLTTLVNDAKLDIDIKMENADLSNNNKTDNLTSFTFKMKGLEGEQKLSVNTSALESKIAAFKLINMISESTGKAFAPYCEAILPIMVEHMQYKMSRVIRKYSLKTIKNILFSVGEPTNATLFKNMFSTYITLIDKANQLNDLKELKLLFKYFFMNCRTLNEENKEVKNYMDEQTFAILGPHLNKALELVKTAKIETITTLNMKKAGLEVDDEDMEAIKDELAKVCSASTYVMEISGQLVLNFGIMAAGMVKQNLMNFFAMNLNNYKGISESELLDSTCFFCDYIEYADHSDENMISELNNKYLEIFKWTESIDVKQTLCYGMGVFSMFISNKTYASTIANVYNALIKMINSSEAFEEENVVATENAIGALGKVIYFQKENKIINDESVKYFLKHLPLKNEEEEANKSHMMFLEQVANKNANLVNANTAQMIKDTLVRINQEDETNEDINILDEEGKNLIKQLLGQ